MSARASRRSQAAAAYGLPSVPIAEIRTRKWTKQLKTVGHLTIPKWIPDQEQPTEALQRGAYKKSKGRKRAGEVGRMTRSVRQHLDAPLELLQEMTVQTRHSSRQSSPARATPASSTPARTPVPMPSPDATSAPATAPTQAPVAPAASAVPVKTEVAAAMPAVQPGAQPTQPVQPAVVETAPKVEPVSAPAPTPAMIPMMPPVSNQMMTDVPSDEQLEMVLDDLPMLDADDSFNLDALDPAFLPHPAPSHPVAAEQPGAPTPSETSQRASVDNSSTSVSEDEASANSGSSMPSMSPQSSPMMSRSPSP